MRIDFVPDPPAHYFSASNAKRWSKILRQLKEESPHLVTSEEFYEWLEENYGN